MGTRLERASKDALLAAVVGFVTVGVTLPWAHTQESRESIDGWPSCCWWPRLPRS